MDKVKQLSNAFQPKANNPRLMKFPYTFGAQIALFPYRQYWQHQWIFRYWAYASVLCLPLFMWITKKVNNPANVEKWKEIRRKELLETHYLDDPDSHH